MKSFLLNIFLEIKNIFINMSFTDILILLLLIFIFIGVSDCINLNNRIFNIIMRMFKNNKELNKNMFFNEIPNNVLNKYEPIDIIIKKKNKKLEFKINYPEITYCVFNDIKLWSVDEIVEYGKDDNVKYKMKNTNINGLEGTVSDVAALFNNKNLSILIDKYGK